MTARLARRWTACLAIAAVSAAPAARPATDAGPLPETVAFAQGAVQFAAGDRIAVTDVRGTAAELSAGNIYCVRGTYTLASRDRATLAAFTTAVGSNSTPTLKVQAAAVTRGSGTFTLYLPMPVAGEPHVSFYPAADGGNFGGVYFDDAPRAK